MNKAIKEKMSNQLSLLRDKYHIKKMGVFGSFARGEEEKGSDLDILVEFERPIGFFDFLELEDYLSKALHKKVDLVSKKAIKPIIKRDILKEVQYV